jgi:hypothetical protein
MTIHNLSPLNPTVVIPRESGNPVIPAVAEWSMRLPRLHLRAYWVARSSQVKPGDDNGGTCLRQTYFSPNHRLAMPRKEKNPTTSVIVVTNGPEDTAGSTPRR